MGIAPGTRVGAYEILGALGAGGMGEVYRARDVNLGRDVALKFLPAAFAADADWRRRFEREARLLASLSHPNLATVHRFEGEHTPPFLVMELVPGETLAARIGGRPMVIDDALDVLRQIAAGLEAAHDAGIIHRDLKPSNITITPEGAVKILDFGLAKAVADAPSDAASLQTETTPHTQQGIVLGTAAYMSPEQARGSSVDRRSDIWAFGCVGYEAICGCRAFPGDTPTDTIAAVLRGDPDWDRLPSGVPPGLRELLTRCLRKDPSERLRDARDLRLTIEDIKAASRLAGLATGAAGLSPALAPSGVKSRARLAWIVAGLAVLASIGFWWNGRRPAAETPRWQRFTQLTDQAGVEEDPVVSPDGTSIAYARQTGGTWDLYVQRVGGHNPLLVAGDPARNERLPAFSPNGATIAFHDASRNGGIFVVGATGESVRRLTDFGFHPTWSNDGGRIAFSTEEAPEGNARFTISTLWVVDLKGGAPKQIYDRDAVHPAWSPSGARIAFMAVVRNSQRDLYTIPAGGGPAVPVTDDAALDAFPVWSSDGRFLYFSSDRGGFMNVWRVAIDEASGRPRGAPEPVTSGVVATANQPSLSKDGARLVFKSRVTSANPAFVTFDPDAAWLGDPKMVLDRTGILRPSDISPDGKWLVLTNQGEVQEDVFICRTDGSEVRRLTDDMFRDRAPQWSPDGGRVVFYSNRAGGQHVWTIRSDGGGLTQVSALDVELAFPHYAPGGTRILATALRDRRVVVLDLSKPLPIRTIDELPGVTTGDQLFIPGRWSPDGQRALGTLDSAGGQPRGIAVYDQRSRLVRTVDSESPGGGSAIWLPDSRRVMFRLDRGLVILDVDSGMRRDVSLPANLAVGSFVAAPDGRGLYMTALRTESDVWMAEIR